MYEAMDLIVDFFKNYKVAKEEQKNTVFPHIVSSLE